MINMATIIPGSFTYPIFIATAFPHNTVTKTDGFVPKPFWSSVWSTGWIEPNTPGTVGT